MRILQRNRMIAVPIEDKDTGELDFDNVVFAPNIPDLLELLEANFTYDEISLKDWVVIDCHAGNIRRIVVKGCVKTALCRKGYTLKLLNFDYDVNVDGIPGVHRLD